MAEVPDFFQAMAGKIGRTIHKKRRHYFEVQNENLHEVVTYLFKTMGCRLSTATATEVYRGIEVLYHFSHDPTGTYYCPRVLMTDREKPQMNSITPIVPGAEWIEREMSELLGIEFIGHPKKVPLLSRNNPDFPDKPLRIRRTT
ncbi:MAG: NADH-quinone oxidoreductase subunit C [candidate division KSB1 bacterium]|nr:NADH-quinone oxidoreductase subunit C [candidate division KSB1 bacterium]